MIWHVPMIVLDANCFIDATDSSAAAYPHLQRIFASALSGRLKLAASRHTLAEVKYPTAAWDLAGSVEVVPYWPIGAIADQVATIKDLAGTWEDAVQNQKVQEELEALAKSGNDVRDRGAYLDALRAGANVFITSDKQLVGGGPARRIEKAFKLRVLTPCQLVAEDNL
jgi:predicted nucleic acid-binding protein